MKQQFKYALKTEFYNRYKVFIMLIAVNIIFAVFSNIGDAVRITGTVLSSFALGAAFVITIISDVRMFQSVFTAPHAYMTMLTPVPRGKILFAKITSAVLFDLAGLTLGIAGVTLQAVNLAEETEIIMEGTFSLPLMVLAVIVFYFFIISLIMFELAIRSSFFYARKGGGLFGLVIFAVVLYLFSLTDIILALFAPVSRRGLFFSVEIYAGYNAATFAALLFYAVKCAVLLFASAKLLERRANI